MTDVITWISFSDFKIILLRNFWCQKGRRCVFSIPDKNECVVRKGVFDFTNVVCLLIWIKKIAPLQNHFIL